MKLPLVCDDLNPKWWGDREIIEDIALENKSKEAKEAKEAKTKETEEADEVAFDALRKPEVENDEWNTVISKKTRKSNIQSDKETNVNHGTITNITKERGFIKSTNGVLYVFYSTSKFKINDKVTFSLSTSKQKQKFKKAIKLKHV
tara:strand:+ start:282 stop:719 length:438 start_codon:yes stop_codon:yes gene_type:complete